mgnify:CR=1 FL=1
MIKKIVSSLCFIFLIGCAGTHLETKKQAFPAMYDERQPLSIVVVPAINNTTAVEASEYFNVTITEPLSNYGYYTMPVEIVRDIFLKEGVVDSSMIKGLPTSIFKKNFGADAVLFVTINQWDKNYAVLAANVSVELEYVMLSTDTNEIIWQYSTTRVVDTTGSSTGFILMDILNTAVTTAITDYVPIAKMANYQAFVALPHGQYSKLHRTDMDEGVVYKKLKEAATDDQ